MRLPNGDIYLDYNATTPIDPRVIEAMNSYQTNEFGNPSSSHKLGQNARDAVELARTQVAGLLRCHPKEVVFTSGGSESNNLALKGIVNRYTHKGQHIIISAVEHPAISQVTNYLMNHGFRISYLPVDDQGVVRVKDLQDIITSKTILVSVMHANNEVGSIQPIQEIARITHDAGALLHTDAAQSASKIPVHVDSLHCDMLSIAGHKLYGPKGVGALYIKTGLSVEPLIHGADHEGGVRAGTENVAGLVGLGEAAEIARLELEVESERLSQLRNELQSKLKHAFPEIRINAMGSHRLPNTLSISFPDLHALDIMEAAEGLMMSAGAACHSGDGKGSGVLEAMGVPLKYQIGTLRISLGRFCDADTVDQAFDILSNTVSLIKS